MDIIKEKIRNVSSSTEFFIIVTVCLGYFILGSTWAIFNPYGNEIVYTNANVLWILTVEILALILSYNILSIRGWVKEDFQFEISWILTGGGVLILCIVYVLYIITGSLLIKSLGDFTLFTKIAFRYEISFPIIIAMCTVNSIFEEYVVVSYVIRSLEKNNGPFFAISVSVLLRFFYHLYQGPVAIISIIPLGLIFAYVYCRWRQLWPLIFAHGLMNLIALTQ